MPLAAARGIFACGGGRTPGRLVAQPGVRAAATVVVSLWALTGSSCSTYQACLAGQQVGSAGEGGRSGEGAHLGEGGFETALHEAESDVAGAF